MKKIQIKISIEQRIIYIKNIVKTYIKRIEKDLKPKTFKHYSYIKHYIIILEFVQFIRIKKTPNITFNKESRIIEGYLMIKD